MTATVEQVKQFIEESTPQSEELKLLSEALFEKASTDFLAEFDPEALLAMTVNALNFIKSVAPDEIKVRVYNPSFETEGWEAPYTVLEVVLSDRPFVVDSLQAEVQRQRLGLHYLLHPILPVELNENGVARILPRGSKGTLLAYELLLVEHQEDQEKHRALEEAVRRVLEDVVLATEDFTRMRERLLSLRDYLQHQLKAAGDEERALDIQEYEAFLAWLDAGNFVYLGYREYDVFEKGGAQVLQLNQDSTLGILSKTSRSAYREPKLLADLPESLRQRITGGPLVIVSKTNAEATVHRPTRMDYVGVKKLNEHGEPVGEMRLLGLLTTKALSTPVQEIPILRRKLAQVIALDGAIEGSHDYKQIVSIFDSMPRDELFWSDARQLHRDIRTIMGVQQERGVRVTVRPDPLARGLGVMVVMPRERFNAQVRQKIQELLTEKLEASRVDYQLSMGEDENQVRFHFFLMTDLAYQDLDLPSLEREVSELTRGWYDRLLERLVTVHGEVAGRRLAKRYKDAFGEDYRASNSVNVTVHDLDHFEALDEGAYRVDLVNPAGESYHEPVTHLKIYHCQDSLVLSEIMPMLENLGLKVLEQMSYMLSREDATLAPRGIDIFRVQDKAGAPLDIRRHKDKLVSILLELLHGRAENDRLNQLLLYAELDWQQIGLLRTLQTYYGQIEAATSRRFINDSLLNHPRAASAIYHYFESKFGPNIDEREARLSEAKEAFLDSLTAVSSLAEDRTLRGLFNVVEATVRTNYFSYKPFISLKVRSSAIESMPEPRPLFEIIVVGRGVEGIHLRGGKVARGGLRWSDRPDDYRTEVLGLMKTQMTKNAVIVPVGSKGGFVLKGAPDDMAALRDYVKEQYKTFISGLLDLTDNIIEGEVVPPEGVVIYDEPDPYLVVAADKGTAKFSDLANGVAADYGFWLGDAFASGGSHGYDHKEEGITARGAWECVSRHFREMGLNVHEDEFTAIGIGDMAGDVFGNGMLYTDKLRLQGAFNHQHIFLDPNPDAAASYKERERLFNLPRSSWEDYDKGLISQGGGVFSRHAKSIPLSQEVKAMLGVKAEALSGQDLIKAILRMPADLLWNGGIGTYVKASTERHGEVGDSSNDAVRIDASELRVKVVGEGGNLGFTQLARIDYALSGGRINTDAVDNSGGVDMSDHEVNIKILLEPLVRSGELSLQQRNRLLEEMTQDVNRLVLRNNYSQSLCLSLAITRSQNDVQLFESLMNYMAGRGTLNPQVEFLPSARALEERRRQRLGLTRPELAILMAYSKMGLYRRLLETEFPDEPYFQHYLFDYFPEVLHGQFAEAIKNHRLHREIVATQFTNKVVDLLGITFVHRSIRETGANPVEVIRAALVVLEILEVAPFLERIFALDNKIPAETQYEVLHRLVATVEDIVNWLLFTGADMSSLEALIETYREPLQNLRGKLTELLPERERERYGKSRAQLEAQGFGTTMANDIASLEYLPSAMNVIDAKRLVSVALDEAGRSYYALGDRLSLGWLRDNLRELTAESKWEKIALGGLVMDLRQVQRQLTMHYLAGRQASGTYDLEAFLNEHGRLLERYDVALGDLRESDGLSLAGGEVLARILSQLVENTRGLELA